MLKSHQSYPGGALIALAVLAFACSDESAETTETGTSTSWGGTETTNAGTTNNIEVCANPEFPENYVVDDPILYMCEGQQTALFDFCAFSAGACHAGFGTEVAVGPIAFPSEFLVGACCDDVDDVEASPYADQICNSDCAAASCNIALNLFNNNLENPQIAMSCGDDTDCVMRVQETLTTWRDYLQANMDICQQTAMYPHDDPESLNIFKFPKAPCSDTPVPGNGCLSNGRIIFGGVVNEGEPDETIASCAEARANLDSPFIPPQCDESPNRIPEKPGRSAGEIIGGTAHITGPGNKQVTANLTGAFRVAQYECAVEPCALVFEQLDIEVEDFKIGPAQFSEVRAELLQPAFGSVFPDSTTFPSGAIRFRITGVAKNPKDKAQQEFEVFADSDAPTTCNHDPATVSLEGLFLDLGPLTVEASIDPSPCEPVDP